MKNVGKVRSNNTAELTGIGETLLYILEELRSSNPPHLSRIMLRPDSEYAMNCTTGKSTARENTQMAAEIKRHYKDMETLCNEKNITVEWEHVAAHDNRKWNCRADDLAKEYATSTKPSKRAKNRNKKPITPDGQRWYTDVTPTPGRRPDYIIPTDNDKALNAEDTPEDANFLEWYANTPIHRIPAEHLGILCDLVPTKIHINSRSLPKVRQCYNRVLDELRKDDNVQASVWWRKAIFLPSVLLTPVVSGRLTLNERCKLVLSNDWTQFTFSSFIRKKHIAPGPKESTDFDRARVKRSKIYLKAGEISRGYKALQSENHPIPPADDVFERLADLHPPRPESSTIPDLPEDLPYLTIPREEVENMIKKAKKCVTNCPITALRYELLKQLLGQTYDQDEHQFLGSFTWLTNKIANGMVPVDIAKIVTSTQAIALSKKDNGIRPIGLRDGLVNFTTKCVLKHLEDETEEIFDDVNYALAGPKKMDELIAITGHTFRITPENDRLFGDWKNAFNKMDRNVAGQNTGEACTRLARYYHFLYQRSNTIWARNGENSWGSFTASQGGTQGCVLAPMMFGFGSLRLYESITNMMKEKENSFFGAYLDDSVISAPHEDTVRAFQMIQEEGTRLGMEC